MDINAFVPLGSVIIGALALIVLIVAVIKLSTLNKLLNRLSEQIPGTGMTAKELANELGGSIDQAFSNYVPKPEALASALGQAVEAAGKKQQEDAERLHQSIADTAKNVQDGLASAGRQTADQLQQANATMAESAKALKDGFSGVAEKFQATLGGYAEELQNALQGAAAQSKDQLAGVLAEHAAKIETANQTLAAQLNKIATLETDIKEVLRVQQVVDGTMRTISSSEAFVELLTSIQSHLRESEKLLREAARPRTIRLVENEGEVSQG